MIKVGNKPEGTYLAWLDVSAVADKIGAQKLADAENRKPQPISMLTGKPDCRHARRHGFALVRQERQCRDRVRRHASAMAA